MKRRFENPRDSTYWEVAGHGSWLTTRSGPTGASGGQGDSQMFKTIDELAMEVSRRVAEKRSSGYEEVAEPGETLFEASLLWRLVAERSESSLPPLVESPADELAAWRVIRTQADLSGWAARLLFSQPCSPGTTSFAKLCATMTNDVYGTALVCAAFSNLEFLCAWDNDDERTYLVVSTPTTGHYHPVYWFVPRFLELDDKSWSSISAFVWRDREDAEGLPSMAPYYLDPLLLSRRSTWLTCALAGVGTGSVADDTKNVADVASFSEEAECLAEHAHLACYWLLHHYVAGNADMLGVALQRSQGNSHPWVAQIREILTQAGGGSPPRLGAIDDEYRKQFAQSAPARAFAGDPSTPDQPVAASTLQVHHDKFGDGTVIELLGSGESAKAVVDFDRVGRKILLQRFLRGLPKNGTS